MINIFVQTCRLALVVIVFHLFSVVVLLVTLLLSHFCIIVFIVL